MPRPRTDIRPRILAAARERFASAGVDASSLRGIATDAGTSIGMVYYYFPTKDDLFLAVVEDVYDRLLTQLEQALGAAGDFKGRVLELYRRIAHTSTLERQVVGLVLREALTSNERLQKLAQRMSQGHVPLIFKAVEAGLARAELRSDLHPIVLMAATLALGAVPQLAVRALGKYLPVPAPTPELLTEQLVEALLHGIAAPAPSKGKGSPPAPGSGLR
jgi:AcrR family transcriptional regulator